MGKDKEKEKKQLHEVINNMYDNIDNYKAPQKTNLNM